MLELFVYYRVPRDVRARWPTLVGDVQDELLQQLPGLQARLLRRDDDSRRPAARPRPLAGEAPPDTWMEVYHRPSGGLDPQTIDRIETAATNRLAAWIQGERHLEVFRVP